MIIFRKAKQLTAYIKKEKKNLKKIGFVPTMGALHSGHLSLLATANSENDLTVCSIFINPTQFNNPDDFKNYPVTIEKDIELLIASHCNILFLPTADEIYPDKYKKKVYDLGKLETLLEGAYRPGHFQGVCQVVDRLLHIVTPHQLYLGQKDYQQCMVLKKLVEQTGLENEVAIKISDTLREADGLALSSRNMRLNEAQRKTAPAIFEALSFIKNKLGQMPLNELKKTAAETLTTKGFEVDYVEIADAKTLDPARDASTKVVALIAAHLGAVRLIDNLILN